MDPDGDAVGIAPLPALLAHAKVYALTIEPRRDHIARLLAKWGFESAVLVPGIAKEDVDLEAWVREGKVARGAEEVTLGRAACHFGHRRILESFLAGAPRGDELAVVFEDDLEDRDMPGVRADLARFLAAAPAGFDMLQLGFLWESREERERINDQVCRCHSAVGRHAYAVTPRGARVLLQETLPQDAPGDQMYLRAIRNRGLVVYQPEEPIFRQDRIHFASEIVKQWRPAQDFKPSDSDVQHWATEIEHARRERDIEKVQRPTEIFMMLAKKRHMLK